MHSERVLSTLKAVGDGQPGTHARLIYIAFKPVTSVDGVKPGLQLETHGFLCARLFCTSWSFRSGEIKAQQHP